MAEHKCPSRYRPDTDEELLGCVRYLGHVEDGIEDHESEGYVWFTAHEYHESTPTPEPRQPWRLIDKEGYGLRAALTRSEAEALCPGGGRAMKLVDADAVIQEPVDVDSLCLSLPRWLATSEVAAVLRAAGIPIKEDDDE